MTEQPAQSYEYASRQDDPPSGWARGLIVFALDVFIIWALAVHGGDVKR